MEGEGEGGADVIIEEKPEKGNGDCTSSSKYPTAPLSKTKIESLIQELSPRVTFLRRDSSSLPIDRSPQSRSIVWNTFAVICIDGKSVDFVRCSDCFSVLSWKSGTTTTLSRHVAGCKKRSSGEGSAKVAVQMTLDQFKKKQIPQAAIKDINEAITLGLAKDLKPLGMVKGPGFRHIAQALVTFGATYGFQSADLILQHPTTLKRKLPQLVNEKREKIVKLLKTAPSYPSFAFTTDMWTDCHQQRHFLSLSVHYIDSDFKLSTHLLAVDEFPDVVKTTEKYKNGMSSHS